MDRDLLDSVRSFFSAPEISGPMAYLGSALPTGCRLYIVGGAVRNSLIEAIHGLRPATEDIDVFIAGLPDRGVLESALKHDPIAPGELGGLRWRPTGSPFAFDLVLFERFIGFKGLGVSPTADHLLAALDFDVNAVLFDPRVGALRENRCFDAIRSRIMDLNAPRFADKTLLVYRILLLRHKIDFQLSETLFQIIKTQVDIDTLLSVKSLAKAKQPPAMARKILADYDRVVRYPDYAAYRSTESLVHKFGTPNDEPI